ncbi:MAG: type II toxin-antitoxin system ParD family antitoxin [bacterium]|nr:type II toxin-antitoxin system ParD family antitoxin [bacterium]
MNVSITEHLGQFVQEKVKAGLYNSASEVVREALRLLEQQDQIRQLQLEALRSEIQKGVGSGEATPWDAGELKAALSKRHKR